MLNHFDVMSTSKKVKVIVVVLVMPGIGASPNPINEAAAHALADGVGASYFRIGFRPLGALIPQSPGCG